MIKKVLFALCLIVVFATGFTARTHAMGVSQDSAYIPIEPLWTHTLSISVNLEISNGRAVMTGSVIGRPGTERISVNARLERVNPNGTFTHIGSWNNLNATGSIWAWEQVHHVARGHDYRLTLTATVFRQGTSETVSLNRTTRAN